MTQLFFELIQVTLGNREQLERNPTEKEWDMLFDCACKQSLASITLEGVNRLSEISSSLRPPMDILYEWIGLQQQTIAQNRIQNQRAKELCLFFKKGGFKSCVLKGQGTALYYNKPEYRECGDIDVWVDSDRDIILDCVRIHRIAIGHVDIKHSDINFFEDVPVEVHFLPSWMYNPFTNKKLQFFFEKETEHQFKNEDEQMGFAHTTINFDLVYSIVHIYRHIFSEGIGLRQLMDYYYILQKSTIRQRQEAFVVLRSLSMSSFVGGIMWILCDRFGMKNEYALCPVNVKHGEFLLSEILVAGNFGQYDARMKRISEDKRFKRGLVQLKRNLRFVKYYPSEVIWSPFWKLWHWYWRMKKGYL